MFRFVTVYQALEQGNVWLNRKMLADMAINEPCVVKQMSIFNAGSIVGRLQFIVVIMSAANKCFSVNPFLKTHTRISQILIPVYSLNLPHGCLVPVMNFSQGFLCEGCERWMMFFKPLVCFGKSRCDINCQNVSFRVVVPSAPYKWRKPQLDLR